MDSSAILLTTLILLVAVLYSSVGHGGASGYLAVMALLSVGPELMRPAALVMNVLVAGIGTVHFARAGHLSWRLLWPFAVCAIPAAAAGGALMLPPSAYRPILGAILLISAARLMMIPSARAEEPGSKPVIRNTIPTALVVGGLLGFLAGLTGTGGGIFLSPVLLFLRWADPKRTGATSAAFILLNSLSGLVGYFGAGREPPAEFYAWVGPWAGAAAVGGMIGSYLGARRLRSVWLCRLLSVVLVLAGVKLFLG